MQEKTYKKGSIVFTQNENSNEIYILNEGVLEIIVNQKKVSEINQRGVFFGEMAYILQEKRNATVRTKTNCSCLIIYSKYVEAVVKSSPEIGIILMKSLARRLKKTTNNLLHYINERERNALKINPKDNQAEEKLELSILEYVAYDEIEANNYFQCLKMLNMMDSDQINNFSSAYSYSKHEKKENFLKKLNYFTKIEVNDLLLMLKLYQKYK